MPLHNHTIILVPRTFELRGASNRHRMLNLAEVYDGSAYKQTQGAFVGRSRNRIGFGQVFLSLARGDRSQRPELWLLWRLGRASRNPRLPSESDRDHRTQPCESATGRTIRSPSLSHRPSGGLLD